MGLGSMKSGGRTPNNMAATIAPAPVVVPFDFIRLPTIAIIGMLAYGETIDIWVFVGALIIFTGNYINIWVETRPFKAQ